MYRSRDIYVYVMYYVYVRPHKLNSLLSVTARMQSWESSKNFIIHYFAYKHMGDDLYQTRMLSLSLNHGTVCILSLDQYSLREL